MFDNSEDIFGDWTETVDLYTEEEKRRASGKGSDSPVAAEDALSTQGPDDIFGDWNETVAHYTHQEENPESLFDATVRGGVESFKQIPQLGWGLLAGGAAVGESALGEDGLMSGVKEYAVDKYVAASKDIAKDARPEDSFNYSYEAAKEGDIGALMSWGAHGLGYVGGQAITMLTGAGIGEKAAEVALKKGSSAFLKNMVAKEAAKIAEKSLVQDGLAVTAETIAAKAAEKSIVKLATSSTASFLGTNAFAATAGYGMEGGEIGGDLAKQSVAQGRTLTGEEVFKGVSGTLLAGSLEYAETLLGLKAMKGKLPMVGQVEEMTGVSGRLARGGMGFAEVAPVEAATEYGQTGVEQWAKGHDLSTPEAAVERSDSAWMGALGGAMGLGGGLLTGPKEKAQAEYIQQQAQAAFNEQPQVNIGETPPGTPPAAPTIDSRIAAVDSLINGNHTVDDVIAERRAKGILPVSETVAPESYTVDQVLAERAGVSPSLNEIPAAAVGQDLSAPDTTRTESGQVPIFQAMRDELNQEPGHDGRIINPDWVKLKTLKAHEKATGDKVSGYVSSTSARETLDAVLNNQPLSESQAKVYSYLQGVATARSTSPIQEVPANEALPPIETVDSVFSKNDETPVPDIQKLPEPDAAAPIGIKENDDTSFIVTGTTMAGIYDKLHSAGVEASGIYDSTKGGIIFNNKHRGAIEKVVNGALSGNSGNIDPAAKNGEAWKLSTNTEQGVVNEEKDGQPQESVQVGSESGKDGSGEEANNLVRTAEAPGPNAERHETIDNPDSVATTPVVQDTKAVDSTSSNTDQANTPIVSAPLPDVATDVPVADQTKVNPELVEHTTKGGKGKTIKGIVRTDLTKEEATAIDKYTFKKDGGYFIREKYLGAEPQATIPVVKDSLTTQPANAQVNTASVQGEQSTSSKNETVQQAPPTPLTEAQLGNAGGVMTSGAGSFDSTHAATNAIDDPRSKAVRDAWNKSHLTTDIDGSARRIQHDHFATWHEGGGLTADIGSQYDAHGIAKSNQLGALLNLLRNGVDTSRRFDTAPLVAESGAGAGLGANGAYKDGAFIVTSGKGETITRDGIKTVLVSDSVANTIPALQAEFPHINFIPYSQAQAQLSNPADSTKSTTQPVATKPKAQPENTRENTVAPVVDGETANGLTQTTPELATESEQNDDSDKRQFEQERNLAESNIRKIDDILSWVTANGTREMSKNWEHGAVVRFKDTELKQFDGKQYGHWAALKIAIGKAKTFEELKKAFDKFSPKEPTPELTTGSGEKFISISAWVKSKQQEKENMSAMRKSDMSELDELSKSIESMSEKLGLSKDEIFNDASYVAESESVDDALDRMGEVHDRLEKQAAKSEQKSKLSVVQKPISETTAAEEIHKSSHEKIVTTVENSVEPEEQITFTKDQLAGAKIPYERVGKDGTVLGELPTDANHVLKTIDDDLAIYKRLLDCMKGAI